MMKVVNLFLLFCYLISSHANAQPVVTSLPRPALTSSPKNITIAGIRNSIQTRTILLKATEKITNLQVVLSDLQRADSIATIPPSSIHADLPSNSVATNDTMTMKIEFNLQNINSGQFEGDILLRYNDGQEIALPAMIKVKEPWLLPFLAILFGVMLSVGVSIYNNSKKKEKEQVEPIHKPWERIALISREIRRDTALEEGFKTFIDNYLNDAESAISRGDSKEVTHALEQAEILMDRWRKGRADWINQLQYQRKLIARIEEDPTIKNSNYGQLLIYTLKQIGTTSDLPKLNEELKKIFDKLRQYEQLINILSHFENSKSTILPDIQEQLFELKNQTVK